MLVDHSDYLWNFAKDSGSKKLNHGSELYSNHQFVLRVNLCDKKFNPEIRNTSFNVFLVIREISDLILTSGRSIVFGHWIILWLEV